MSFRPSEDDSDAPCIGWRPKWRTPATPMWGGKTQMKPLGECCFDPSSGEWRERYPTHIPFNREPLRQLPCGYVKTANWKIMHFFGGETHYFNGILRDIPSGYVKIANWKDPPCLSDRKPHNFDWAIFNSKLFDYQRDMFCRRWRLGDVFCGCAIC